MGVPKFYRWISERYPNISRVINDNQIPEFDNFYLDMNGIIHACSHVNEDNCETNITEEEIFRNIFHYIDFLFRMIKPKKVFFMAVDGVAPRAKMNQQRARRFRAGRDRVKKLKTLAEKNNQTLKETLDQHFDTNSITPGTTFMSNLDEQLKYFINIKLTTDPLWKDVTVHLSGHLTPGEGEHKIMEYIRYTRSQPGYDINTRHCLYGLDADLIMLGLVTHEMHFALLREEVKYGPKKVSKILTPEEINWHLLQLCLLRDYIDLEFRSLKEKLKFEYDLESIVDDWILMGYLVGNDFIPHLPHVHINQEALPLLWESYKKVLPTFDGYMNEFGELNLSRFEIYLKELSKYDYDRFEKECEAAKQLHRIPSKKFELDQNPLPNSGFSVDILEKLMISAPANPGNDTNGQLIDNFIATERQTDNIPSSASSNEDNHRPLYVNGDEENHHSTTDFNSLNYTDENKIDFSRSYSSIQVEFRQHKNEYYREKMRCQNVSNTQLQLYVQQYIEALQWILKYYYQGCPSWSWFYPHHYAPYLSDLINFKHYNFTFERGTPFKPFEQLLAVLPPTSRYLLPKILQPLMINNESPLLHFYPEDFQLDQNEKKQDWEAIVLLPFIDEQLLLNSIQKYYSMLELNEQNRNQHKASLAFKASTTFYPTTDLLANNPHFPSLKQTCASVTEYPVDFYRPPNLIFKHGRFNENQMIYFPKFPILNVLPYEFEFKKGIVDIFDSRSKATTLVLNLSHRPDSDLITYNEQWNPEDNDNTQQPFQIINRQSLIERYLGKRVFVNWPHFEYGIVCAITDFRHMYTWSNIPGGSFFSFQSSINEEHIDMKNNSQTAIYVSRFPFEYSEENMKSINMKSFPLDAAKIQMEYTKAININRRYENRQGVCIGPTPLLLYVCPLVGYRTKCSANSDKCETVMCFSNQGFAYPLQTTVLNIPNYKQNLSSIPQTIHENFQLNSTVFSLQSPNYSCLGYVQQITKDNNGKYLVECRMEPSDALNQPDIHSLTNKLSRLQVNYWTAQQVAEYLQTMPSVVSKITGSIIITTGSAGRGNVSRINVGLAWKGNKPVKQLYGYTKKEDQIWFYSDDAVLIISDYMLQFPEIVGELIRKPKDDTYPELNIWPERKGRSRLQEVRTWIKKLPTSSMTLMDGAWQVLDAPVIKEIDRSTKSFFAKHSIKASPEKTKTISIDVNRLFKPNESFGMCDSDLETVHDLYDRVATVRLGTGVPLGTRGTIIGILIGATHLDTFYEVLFDHLPKNSLDAILLGGNNQACRIKVRSYHLLNYSHSLRIRPIANYQQSKSAPNENVWEKRLTEQSTNTKPVQNQNNQQQQQQQPSQPTRILKRGTNETNSTIVPVSVPVPKSAPPVSRQEQPNILDMLNNAVKEQRAAAAAKSSVIPSVEKPAASEPVPPNPPVVPILQENSLISTSAITKVQAPEKVIPSNPIPTRVTETATQLPSFSTNQTPNSLFFRAIEESTQLLDHPSKQQQQQQEQSIDQSMWNSAPVPSLPVIQQKPNDIPMPFQQSWENHSTSTVAPQQPSSTIVNQFASHSSAWEPIPSQQSRNTLFAQAIASMPHTSPTPLPASQFDQTSLMNISSPFSSPSYQSSQQYHQQPQPQPSSILQRAILQSDQQFNTNQASFSASNGYNNSTTFQPFDLITTNNNYLDFPMGAIQNQVPLQQQQQTPVRANPILMESPQIISSPLNASHSSPSSQTQTPQQINSPRASGGSTLQFVPSQVLRKMSKK